MRRFTLYLLACGLFILASTAHGQAVDPVDLELKVQRLLQRLNDREDATRASAEQQLQELGPAILPFLPASDEGLSPNGKERLERIRKSAQATSQEQVNQPSQLSLQGSFRLSELLTQIEKQTGNRLLDYRNRLGQSADDATIDVNIDKQDFWPAMDKLADQAGLAYYSYVGQARSLALQMAAPNQKPLSNESSYHGIFRVAVTEVQTQRMYRVTGDGTLRLRLEILWEPRVSPILIRHPYADLKAIDDTGKEITAEPAQGIAEVPVQSTVAGVELVLPLPLPLRDAKSFRTLTGRFLAIIPGKVEAFEFDNLMAARDVTKRGDGVEVTLESVRRNGSAYVCRLKLKMPATSAPLESHLDWASNNVVFLRKPDGTKIDNPNYERYLERNNEVGYDYLFPVEGDLTDYRLIYQTPSSMIEVPVDYELKDLPLP